MSYIHQRLQQQSSKEPYELYTKHHLDKEKIKEGLLFLFLEINFHLRIMDFQKFYNSLKENDFFPSLSILFLNIGGPFLTFQKFKAFFENLCLQGLLDFDVEEYNGMVEVRFPILSNTQIEELVSQIKIVSSISLNQVFVLLSGTLIGGPKTWIDLYNGDRSFQCFFKGKDKKELRSLMEKVFKNHGVTVSKLPHLSFLFPSNFSSVKSHVTFMLELVSEIGVDEIPYISGSFKEESDLASTDETVFYSLIKFFSSASSFKISEINLQVSEISPEQRKQIFALLVRFCFVIQNDIATPHSNFSVHVDHFVVAFMRITGVSLEEVRVQGTIRSGPTWVHKGGKKHVVCSSVATLRDCRKAKTCRFLHSKTEHGIITTHCGKVFVVCRDNAMFDKTPHESSILDYNFKSGMVSIKSTHPVACEGFADPETHVVAGGGSAYQETQIFTRGGSAYQETHPVACGGSAEPETRVVAFGGSNETKIYQHQMLRLMNDELKAFDNPPPVDQHAVERFSFAIPPPPESGSHSDNIVRLIGSQTGDQDALLRTASTFVLAMKAKNLKN